MYLLAVVEDKLKILPEQFDRDTSEVLIEQIDEKYSNKVLLEVGLCISFYDFVEVGSHYVYPAEGSAHQVVKFRMIVYRPFIGEALTGRILRSDEEGISVTMKFFDDIYIPSKYMQQPSSYNPDKKSWVWHHSDEGDFSMEKGELIRFKVIDCIFTQVTNSMKERRISSTTSATNIGQPGHTGSVGAKEMAAMAAAGEAAAGVFSPMATPKTLGRGPNAGKSKSKIKGSISLYCWHLV